MTYCIFMGYYLREVDGDTLSLDSDIAALFLYLGYKL